MTIFILKKGLICGGKMYSQVSKGPPKLLNSYLCMEYGLAIPSFVFELGAGGTFLSCSMVLPLAPIILVTV